MLSGGVAQASAAVATIYNLGGTISVSSAINASGQFAGSNGQHAVRYTDIPGSGGVAADLGTLGGAGSSSSGINANGQVAGTSGIGGSTFISHAFRYTGTPGSGGFMADLGTLGGANSWSDSGGINANGQVAGTSGSAVILRHAFRYTGTPGSGGAMVDLGTLAGKAHSSAVAINDRGQIAGYCNDYSDDGETAERAFLYTGTPGSGGVMWDLGSFVDGRSRAWGMNANGQVVGSSESAFGQHAFLYNGTPGVDGLMIDLDAWLDANNPMEGAKWTLDTAFHLNDTGLITGWGWYDDGQGLGEVSRAFLLDASALVVPQPGDFNSDGKVDAADYVVWRKTDGSTAGYNTWRSNFGRTSGSGLAASENPVPEPSTFALAALILAIGLTGPFARHPAARRLRYTHR